MRRTLIIGAIAALVVAGCASREVLVRRSAVTPPGVDLSGQWTLHRDALDTNTQIAAAEREAAGGDDRLFEDPRKESRRRRARSLVHVFLETGSNLKITQTRDGLFISFDRAIVEEYRFGEYGRVNVGPVEADRSSGWEDGAYVIETLDDDGAKLFERYRLVDDGRALSREIRVYRKDDIELSVEQRFTRRGERSQNGKQSDVGS